MPKGIDIFRDRFAAHTDKYVLIGGTACELAMLEADLQFRATKDLDIVLTVETLNAAFSGQFWSFVAEGGYEHQQAGPEGKTQCYRFVKPKDVTFPVMLELFSRRHEIIQAPADRPISRIPADDDASSLSAILMDDDYYALVQSGRRVVNGLSTLDAGSIIPLKAKAFLDLSERKTKGAGVKSDDIKKHKLDVFRLSVLLAESTRIVLPEHVRADFHDFVRAMDAEQVDTAAIGLKDRSKGQVLAALSNIYGLPTASA